MVLDELARSFTIKINVHPTLPDERLLTMHNLIMRTRKCLELCKDFGPGTVRNHAILPAVWMAWLHQRLTDIHPDVADGVNYLHCLR